jgi:hypothetical protein
MAQLFWEQIKNELPELGEYLTGSLNVSGSFATTGSVFIDLDGVEEVFNIKVGGEEKLKVNTQGILQFNSQSVTPTPVEGGLFYSSSNEYYFGFNN